MMNDLDGGQKTWATRRQHDPLTHQCPLHLKRVCGVCTHFQGRLRQEESGPCTRLKTTVHPRRGAGKCHAFERRSK